MSEYKPKKISRRQALSTSLGTAGIAAVGGTALNSIIAGRAYAAGDETIKVALIGCGGRGTGAICQAINTKGPVKLWAMADMFEDRLQSSLANLTKGQKATYNQETHQGFGTQVDVPPERRFVGFDAYKKAIDCGADVVILTTPPHFRPMHYEYAVKQGKHVFMEKPLAVDAPGIRQILAANEEAKKKDLKVGVGFMYRHNTRYQEAVKRVQDGAVGEIALIRCYRNMGLVLDTCPRTPDISEMHYQLRNPYHFIWLGGDFFVDALIHVIDICLWMKGSHPVIAQGQGGRQFRLDTQRGDAYDHHFIEYTFDDGIKMFAQNREMLGCWNEFSARADGTKGNANLTRGRIEGNNKWRFRGRVPNHYQVEHDVLFDAVRNNKPHNETEYSAISTMTAIMGRMASYSGQMIRWEDALNSKVSYAPEKYALDATPPVVAGKDGLYPVPMPGITKVL